MTKQFNGLKCSACDGDLTPSVGFTGADWESKAGEDSGYKYELSLNCTNCNRVYIVGYLNNERAYSAPNPDYDRMFTSFARSLKAIERLIGDDLRDRELARLMTEMEQYYAISMNKERFDREISPQVRELYLAVSSARNL